MKCVILCGGKGTRFKERTDEIPKALITVGNRPILHHLMNSYARYGFKEFVLCLGYKSEVIKKYIEYKHTYFKDWKIDLVETGPPETLKATRLLRVKDYIDGDDFFLSYGDDLSDLNIRSSLEFHKFWGKVGTMTGIHPRSQYGLVTIDHNNNVKKFEEKPILYDKFSNAGYYIFNKKIFNYLEKYPNRELEDIILPVLSEDNQLKMYFHEGKWNPMNNFKEWEELETLWQENKAFWVGEIK